MAEHVAVLHVVEADVLHFNFVFEVAQGLGVGCLPDGVLGLEDVVDAVHGGQAHGYHVGLACEVLDGVDDAVEDDHVEDEGGGVDEAVAVQDEPAAEEQYDDDDDGAHGLGDGVGGVDAHHHAYHAAAELVVDEVEAAGHLLFGDEGLDDAQAAECLFYLRHDFGESGLYAGRLALEALCHGAHEPCGGGRDDEHEGGELPADGEEGDEADDDGDGLLDEGGDGRGDGVLHHLYVGAHAHDDVALALGGEEAQGQVHDFVVHVHADVADDACGEGHHDVGGAPVADALQGGHDDKDGAHEAEGEEGAVAGDELLHPGVGVVDDEVLVQAAPRPLAVGVDVLVYLEEDVQYGDEHYEGEDVEPLCHEVEHDAPDDVRLVGPEIAPDYVEELLYHFTSFSWFMLVRGVSEISAGRFQNKREALPK